MHSEEHLKGKLHCFIKDTRREFKLFFLPSQRRQCKLLADIDKLHPEIFASFIANAQTSFTGTQYGYSYSRASRKTPFKNEHYTKIIVLPIQLIRVVEHPHIMTSKYFIFDEVYPELRGVNCFVMDAYSPYKIYDMYTDKVDKDLIRFNSLFDDFIKHLVDVRLNNPDLNNPSYPLRFSMDYVSHELKEHQSQR